MKKNHSDIMSLLTRMHTVISEGKTNDQSIIDEIDKAYDQVTNDYHATILHELDTLVINAMEVSRNQMVG